MIKHKDKRERESKSKESQNNLRGYPRQPWRQPLSILKSFAECHIQTTMAEPKHWLLTYTYGDPPSTHISFGPSVIHLREDRFAAILILKTDGMLALDDILEKRGPHREGHLAVAKEQAFFTYEYGVCANTRVSSFINQAVDDFIPDNVLDARSNHGCSLTLTYS
eukprot:9259170-Pyramimonas_sp.AAC.1